MRFLSGCLALCCLVLAAAPLRGAEVHDQFPEPQTELCMIGDSITWWGEGDAFRKELLKRLPGLAFVGTHSAKYGYSHAGEGGNNTWQILKRIDAIPDSRYYHLLVGVNDSAAAKSAAETDKVAEDTAGRIVKIVHALLAKKGTEKVFLGTIAPCVPDSNPNSDQYQFRDLAASKTNELLRKNFATWFPGGKVVLVEYEIPLRARADWKTEIRLHPTPQGYTYLADILAPVLKAGTTPDPIQAKPGKGGVRVVNLWDEQTGKSAPLIPGHYSVSFDVKKIDGKRLIFFVNGEEYDLRAEAGKRLSCVYQAEKVTKPLEITFKNGEAERILVEKMRPSKQPSVYGKGSFIDTASPIRLGEKIEPAVK